VLLLVDIDGTLVAGATRAHSEALHAALTEVHGIDSKRATWNLSPAGRTDGEIARAILLGAGVDATQIDERADRVRERCCEIYARMPAADLSHTVLPGVVDVMSWLTTRNDVLLGLVTGNFEPIARLKLRQAGIGQYFPPQQGAFGSDSEDRSALPAIARRRAGRSGVPYPRAETIVVGDTPRDIACARADGVRCIAVATGPFGLEELQDADRVVADADGLRGVLTELLDG
jgi:phosphoglycolate phosphatase-like HAD superfamily hydrolase